MMSASPQAIRRSPVVSEEILASLKFFPSAPDVLPRIKALLCDSTSSIQEVANFVRLDPGLLLSVLEAGCSRETVCLQVEEVLQLHGYGRVLDVVDQQVVIRPLSAYGLGFGDYWWQSLACAHACEWLAGVSDNDVSQSYHIGLLHNTGVIVMNEWMLQHSPIPLMVWEDWAHDYIYSERKLTGMQQAEVGALFLKNKKLPDILTEPIHWQYSPGMCDSHHELATLLHIAKWVKTVACSEASPWPTPAMPNDYLLETLRIRNTQLHKCVAYVREKLRQIDADLKQSNSPFPSRHPRHLYGWSA